MSNFKINIFKKGVAKEIRDYLEDGNFNEIDKENTELLLIESILGNNDGYSNDDLADIQFIFSKINPIILNKFINTETNFEQTIKKYPFLSNNFKSGKFNIIVAESLLKLDNGEQQLCEYLENLYKEGNAPKETSNIRFFILNLTKKTIESLFVRNPQIKDYFNINYINTTSQQNNNILQEVAIYNPQIYTQVKNIYPELNLYANHREHFLFSIRENGKEIFKEEVSKKDEKYILDNILTQGSYFQQEIVFDQIINNKKIFNNMNPKEAFYAISFLSKNFNSIWGHGKDIYKEIYKNSLRTSNNITFIENSIYFALSFAGVLNFKADMNERETRKVYEITDEILSCIENNPNIKGVKILNIFEKHEFPEFWLNTHGVAERFLKSQKTTFFSSLQENQILNDNHYMEKIRDFFFKISTMIENKEFKAQVTDTWETMSMVFDKMAQLGKTLLVESIGDNPILFFSENENTSKKIGIISTFNELSPFVNSLSRESCINILSSNMPTNTIPFSNGQTNFTEETKNKVLNKLLEKTKGHNFTNVSPDIAERNIFIMCSIYSEDELFNKGKIKEIFNIYPYNINELLNKEESLLFLLKHVDRDLTQYGINTNNPMIPKCLAEHISTNRVLNFEKNILKFSKIYNNTSYREKNGDNILHNLISNNNEPNVNQFNIIASAFPDLVNEANKKKKYPIDLIVSKIKKTTNQTKNNKNAQIIKTICNLDFSPPMDKVLSLYNDLQSINDKLVIMFPSWENYLQKIISLNIMENNPLNNGNNDLEYKDNNEWKI